MKSRKDNGICEETENDTRESRDNIEKNTGRNEEVCRQK